MKSAPSVLERNKRALFIRLSHHGNRGSVKLKNKTHKKTFWS